MAKATHSGTCQCCGNFQKLPNGKLSKHGYTVDYGWFNGTCSGAGHLPFEESKDLIEGFILSAEQTIDDTLNEIEKIRNNPNPECVYHHGYRRMGYCSIGGYFWEQRAIKMVERVIREGEENEHRWNEWQWIYTEDELIRAKDEGVVTKKAISNLYGPKSEAEAIETLNGHYISNVLEKRVAGLTSYISWQKGRIDNWMPGKLTSIEK